MATAEKFEQFHQANPHVYNLLVKLARQYVSRTGRDRLGFDLIWGVARWEHALATDCADCDYLLDNNYKAYYARMVMGREGDLDGLFELRTSIADHWAGSRGYPVSASYLAYAQTAIRESEAAWARSIAYADSVVREHLIARDNEAAERELTALGRTLGILGRQEWAA